MGELPGRFTAITKRPYTELARWKNQTGKKLIGCFPMHVPEEIIHAAGMLPVALLGSDQPVTQADGYVHPYICGVVRSNFDLSLKGDLDLLDGVVFPDGCLTVQLLSDIWRLHKPAGFYHHLVVPKSVTAPYSERYLLHQFVGLKDALAELGGRDIPEKSIKDRTRREVRRTWRYAGYCGISLHLCFSRHETRKAAREQRSRTCLLANMGQDDVRSALVERTGLPTVVFEGDLCDQRLYSETNVNAKIEAFLEILEQRGPGRGATK